MANPTDDYIPGACNIGREEVRWRKAMAWIGVVGMLGLWGGLAYAKASPLARLWVGGPALMAALGFLQARRGFCVKYGLGGAFSFGPEVGRTEPVEQAEARRQDRDASIRLIGQSVLFAALVALAAFAIPV